MKTSIMKWLGAAACVFVIILGCRAVYDQGEGGDGGITSQGENTFAPILPGFAPEDNDFTDAPVSPGGTGGIVEDDVEAPGEETRSFFTAFQIDPEAEDTAGPVFIVSEDMDKDGLLDLVTGWNQSQPVQLHLQRRDAEDNISFRTINLGGTTPIAIMAGVECGQINDDNGDGDIDSDDWLDVVVLSKATGYVGLCPSVPPKVISELEGEIVVLFSPGDATLLTDGDEWTEMILVNPYIADRWVHNQYPGIEDVTIEEIKQQPEYGGFTSLAVGNIDGNDGDEIIVALNPGECAELDQKPPVNTIDLWINPGAGWAMTSDAWGVPSDVSLSRGVPICLTAGSGPMVKDILLSDVEGDGDLDVVAAYDNALSLNVRWVRNPFFPHEPDGPGGYNEVTAGYSPGADYCIGGPNDDGPCPNGDIDCIGNADGVCVGAACIGGDNDGRACDDNTDCLGSPDGICIAGTWRYVATGWELRPIGQVDTSANVIAIGDIDSDGFDDVLVRSTPGQIVQWFRKPNALTIQPEFPPNDPVPDRVNFPWPVFTLTEFNGAEPEAIALGDVTGDGHVEVIVAAEGAVFWYDGMAAETVFDPWAPNTIIQDESDTDASAGGGSSSAAPGSGVGVEQVDTSTSINTLLVVDLDGDGKNDIVGTLDRRSGAGISDDRIVWYRNTYTEPEE